MKVKKDKKDKTKHSGKGCGGTDVRAFMEKGFYGGGKTPKTDNITKTTKTDNITKKKALAVAKMDYEELLADAPLDVRLLAESITKEGYFETTIEKMTPEDAKIAVAKMDELRPFAMKRIISKLESELCGYIKTLNHEKARIDVSLQSLRAALIYAGVSWSQTADRGPNMFYDMVKEAVIKKQAVESVLAEQALESARAGRSSDDMDI